jgi:calcineurin-like phosphoesterase family protein
VKNLLKLNTKEHNIFFISDLHWDHDKDFIWQKRGYSSVQEMNSHIVDSWNKTVTENDIVFNLGDYTVRDDDSKKSLFLFETLKCKKHYFLNGNHQSGVKQIYKAAMAELSLPPEIVECYPLEVGNVVFCGDYLEISVNGKIIVLSHFPIASWRQISDGAIHVHGHCHCNLKEVMKNRIDVGWEFKKKPVSFKEIIEHVNSHGGSLPSDHHVSEESLKNIFK